MRRLFVSLYVLLCLSILGIGWTLDSLWDHRVDSNRVEDAPLLMLAKMLGNMPAGERAAHISAVASNEALPLSLVPANSVSLSTNTPLAADKVFTVALGENQQMRLVRVGKDVLMAGPSLIDAKEEQRTLFSLLFYLMLGGVAMLWVWPLSRDIRALKEATLAFGRAKWDTRIKLASTSQVADLADTFNEMARHIAALMENQKHLSNAVSHEIRTPLARLKFALALLPGYCGDGSSAEKRQSFLADMEMDLKDIEKLLQEMLTYASLESPSTQCKYQRTELNELIRHTHERLEPLSPIAIALTLPNEPAMAQIDPGLIERALQNLITNAQRFAASKIEVGCKLQGTVWQLWVQDDGIGIPEADQAKIFEPFYRVSSAQNGNKGHGLGLAIIKRIMQRHKGKVTLESQPGRTCFCLHIPITYSG